MPFIHDWFNTGVKAALHLAIDDATSMILGAHFATQETTKGYYHVFYQILDKFGIPDTFYTDNRSTFEYNSGKTDKQVLIQFKRVANTVGTSILTTSVAQAKGRVERSFRTHQDRLIAEFRLQGIKTIECANKYLVEYIKRHNARYAKNSDSVPNVFRQLEKSVDINKLLSIHNKRKILNGNVVSYQNKQYCPMKNKNTKLILPLDTAVTMVETFDDELLILHNDKYYKTELMANYKTTAHTPPMEHPWKAKSYQNMLDKKAKKMS
jgi:hypothetical protein